MPCQPRDLTPPGTWGWVGATSCRVHAPPAPHGPHLWDVDEQTSAGDVGDADEALLDDPLSLDLHAGHGCPRGQEKRRWPSAGMLPDVVNLLWGGVGVEDECGGRAAPGPQCEGSPLTWAPLTSGGMTTCELACGPSFEGACCPPRTRGGGITPLGIRVVEVCQWHRPPPRQVLHGFSLFFLTHLLFL